MSLTCSACLFDVSLGSKTSHYSTEWHRYNVKRKCAGLAPVPLELFQLKLDQLAIDGSGTNGGTQSMQSGAKSQVHTCVECGKEFKSAGTLATHLRSKKHEEGIAMNEANQAENKDTPTPDPVSKEKLPSKERKIKLEKDLALDEAGQNQNDDISDDESSEGEPLPLNACLFCPLVSDSLELSVAHMTSAHSFFIPFPEFLVDLEGLLRYLCYKVGLGRVCLWCNGRGRTSYHSVKALQRHMVYFFYCDIFDY